VENREIAASNLSGIVAAGRTSPKGTTNSSATACCIAASPSREADLAQDTTSRIGVDRLEPIRARITTRPTSNIGGQQRKRP
jgi:hypothetical protein